MGLFPPKGLLDDGFIKIFRLVENIWWGVDKKRRHRMNKFVLKYWGGMTVEGKG